MRNVLLLLLLAATAAFGDELTDSRRLNREAVEAYKAKNFVLFLEKARAAADLRPQHSGLLYNVAAGLALNGRSDDALDVLDRMAGMGMVYDPAKDDDFAALRALPRFRTVNERFERNAQPTSNTKRAFRIERRGIISEGLAYDAKTKRFFVSSVRDGAIFVRDAAGRVKPIIEKQWAIFGMAVDAKRRKLWAATSAIPQNVAFRPDDDGHGAVLELDLDTGKLIHAIPAPDDDKHIFGDVAVAPDGTVYVSDSGSPSIYAIDGTTMRPFIRNGPFGSVQGLAFSTDGKTMYVADYAKGIVALDMATRDSHVLSVPRDVSLLGVDGLYAVRKGTFVGTQNGTNPQRVLLISIAPDARSVTGIRTLASAERDFDDITLGTVSGDAFYFNAAAQWALFGERAKAPEKEKLKPALVLRVPTH